jgi:hypothetical protein
MRDDQAPGQTDHILPLPVVIQPDPMLEEHPAKPLRIIATLAGVAFIVALALYGMTRPAGQQEMAAAPSDTQTAPAGGGAANNAGGQAAPANAAAQNPQPNPQQPTTTGQGAGEHAGQPETGQVQPKGQAGQSKTPPASGGSATSDVGPGAKPAPETR